MLLDDKPFATLTPFKSRHTLASWKHVIFDQPYNASSDPLENRMYKWRQWREVLFPLLGYSSLLSACSNKGCVHSIGNSPAIAAETNLLDEQQMLSTRQRRSESVEMFQVS